MRKMLVVFTAIVIVFCSVFVCSAETDTIDSGSCGTGATWYITGTETDMTLTICGSGKVTKATWEQYNDCIKKVIVENGITEIGEGVFAGCSNLTDITIPFVGEKLQPNGMGTVFGYIFGRNAYSGGVKTLQRYILGSGNNTTDTYSYFYIPSTLTNVTITQGEIRKYVFMGCSGLTNINYPSGLTRIGDFAFSGCKSLSSVTIPKSLTAIGLDAFEGCSVSA